MMPDDPLERMQTLWLAGELGGPDDGEDLQPLVKAKVQLGNPTGICRCGSPFDDHLDLKVCP